MNTTNPLVSIAMATYNGTTYLAEQLDSIIAQSYSPIEIVIADDCSQDNTVALLNSYQQRYPCIQIIINKINTGVTKTFEKAIRHCKGHFIALCDQDDIWEPEKITVLATAIGDHDAVYANSLLVDASGQPIGKSFTNIMNMKTYYNGAPFLLSNSVPGHSILVKRSFIEKILPFPPNLLFDLWIGFCAAGNNGIKFVDETLVKYRQHENNTIGTRNSTNKKPKVSAQKQFDDKLTELKVLATAPIKDQKTKDILQQMLKHFHRKWSLGRSIFFFKHFNEILISKKKPLYRKKLFCIKMFFKPNF